MLALAEVNAQRTTMKVRLIGQDAVGGLYLERNYAITGQDIDQAASFAAKVAAGVIEGRWKETRLASLGAIGGAPADLETIALSVQFTGLKHWLDMRRRLQKIPGLQHIDIKSLHARGAVISVEFAGGASRLTQAAQSQGLAINQRGGDLLLTSR